MDNIKNIEKKWQGIWNKEVFKKTILDKNKKKFFISLTYPGISGFFHFGHFRGYTYCDILARWNSIIGRNVLFTAGVHSSGNLVYILKKKIKDKDPILLQQFLDNGYTEKDFESLKSTSDIITFFKKYFKEAWCKMGIICDWERYCASTDAGYSKFIQWQFNKIEEKKLLTIAPHILPYCSSCGFLNIDSSETDVQKGGTVKRLDQNLIFFKSNEYYLPVLSTRPETIEYVTNLWIFNEGYYEGILDNKYKIIISKSSLLRLSNQFSISNIKNISKCSILSMISENPITGNKTPILLRKNMNKDIGSGIVMSVPSIDLEDAYELSKIGERKVKYPPVLEIDNTLLDPMKILQNLSSLDDIQKENKKLYKKSFSSGIMRSIPQIKSKISNFPVQKAQTHILTLLRERDAAINYSYLSGEVICRCGEVVFLKKSSKQWFINYKDPALKEKTKEWAYSSNIFPEYYKKNLINNIIDWFGMRACARKGKWLGTSLPQDPEWIIEPISDSTIYPAYYLISKYINSKKLCTSDLTKENLEYIFYGTSTTTNPIIKTIRNEFQYWYPININICGKEHRTAHIPVFGFNHVLLFEKKYQPKAILSHEYIISKSKKISKSKGGATPLGNIINRYSADALRLFYCNSGEYDSPVEWKENKLQIYQNKLSQLISILNNYFDLPQVESTKLDSWISFITNKAVTRAHVTLSEDPISFNCAAHNKKCIEDSDSMQNKYLFRKYSVSIFYDLVKDIEWFIKRTESRSKTSDKCIMDIIKLFYPIIPHTAEELWQHHSLPNRVTSCPLSPSVCCNCLSVDEKRENLMKDFICIINNKEQKEIKNGRKIDFISVEVALTSTVLPIKYIQQEMEECLSKLKRCKIRIVERIDHMPKKKKNMRTIARFHYEK